MKCVTVDLEVPASSHIVLEGYVEPGERRREGPFGDHTGLYSQPDDFPVFHLTCITRRKRPTYLTTVVGVPYGRRIFDRITAARRPAASVVTTRSGQLRV